MSIHTLLANEMSLSAKRLVRIAWRALIIHVYITLVPMHVIQRDSGII
jgi:hypothetical protein